jgi:hypothetical protein
MRILQLLTLVLFAGAGRTDGTSRDCPPGPDPISGLSFVSLRNALFSLTRRLRPFSFIATTLLLMASAAAADPIGSYQVIFTETGVSGVIPHQTVYLRK